MRVIAGTFRSRNLLSLEGRDTRPTYDRLKETLFNVLHAAGVLEGADFLDLFAGTGSIAIEAISRGARSATLVENHRKAATVIRKNLESLDISDAATLLEMPVADALAMMARTGETYDVVFFDPPYAAHGEYDRVLRLLAGGTAIKSSTIVVAEHEKRFDPGDGHGSIRRYRTLAQGDSALSFYRLEQARVVAEADEQPEAGPSPLT